jgi:hypothetical protein
VTTAVASKETSLLGRRHAAVTTCKFDRVAHPFDGFVEKAVRASTTCLIMADHNRYRVDARAAGGRCSATAENDTTDHKRDVSGRFPSTSNRNKLPKRAAKETSMNPHYALSHIGAGVTMGAVLTQGGRGQRDGGPGVAACSRAMSLAELAATIRQDRSRTA